jgi:hypothetical protein
LSTPARRGSKRHSHAREAIHSTPMRPVCFMCPD